MLYLEWGFYRPIFRPGPAPATPADAGPPNSKTEYRERLSRLALEEI